MADSGWLFSSPPDTILTDFKLVFASISFIVFFRNVLLDFGTFVCPKNCFYFFCILYVFSFWIVYVFEDFVLYLCFCVIILGVIHPFLFLPIPFIIPCSFFIGFRWCNLLLLYYLLFVVRTLFFPHPLGILLLLSSCTRLPNFPLKIDLDFSSVSS